MSAEPWESGDGLDTYRHASIESGLLNAVFPGLLLNPPNSLVTAWTGTEYNIGSEAGAHIMSHFRFLPAVIAAATDVATSIFVFEHQPDYPFRFLIFQLAMFGLALLLAGPYRTLWFLAFALLILGVLLAVFSVGFFYIPTVVAAGWVMVRRLAATSEDRAG